MPKSVRIDKKGRVLEVFPWSVDELKKNKLYHKDLVAILHDCPDPVEENWWFHGHRAYRYAPKSYFLTGKRINKRMEKAKPLATFRPSFEDKTKYDSADLELRLELARAGYDPDVILARESSVERAKGWFGA